MVRINVRVEGGPRLVGEIRRASAYAVREPAEMIGRDMARRANELAAQRYDQRPRERRRSPGSRRLAGAFSYQLRGGPDFPIEIRFRVLGGEDVQRRAIVLNFGKPATTITPSGKWPLRGRYKSSNPFRREGPAAPGRILAWPSGGVGPPNVFTDSANSRHRPGDRFLEEARDWAVSRNAR